MINVEAVFSICLNDDLYSCVKVEERELLGFIVENMKTITFIKYLSNIKICMKLKLSKATTTLKYPVLFDILN